MALDVLAWSRGLGEHGKVWGVPGTGAQVRDMVLGRGDLSLKRWPHVGVSWAWQVHFSSFLFITGYGMVEQVAGRGEVMVLAQYEVTWISIPLFAIVFIV